MVHQAFALINFSLCKIVFTHSLDFYPERGKDLCASEWWVVEPERVQETFLGRETSQPALLPS